ncbi:hypothetical protein [Acinetobacter bereziniae]|uniref:hypothetical protein n=1 Tax=Acinetobacter bereziniae TaxID=106648 RepID=UPI00357102C0
MLNFIVTNFVLASVITFILFKWVSPNIPENVKIKANNNFGTFLFAIIIMTGILIFLFLPIAFKYIALNLWNVPPFVLDENGKNKPIQLSDLGALGDIYGSLNTLFTSVTLGIVAYTTGLQRKANEYTYNSNQIQINEAKYSNFSNLFYSLLNHKQVKLNSLMIKKNETIYDANKIFMEITEELSRLCRTEWESLDNIDKKNIKDHFIEFINTNLEKYFYAQIHAYFLVYSDLLDLINRSEISEENKIFFRRIVSNSMTGPEQIALLWVSAYQNELNTSLNDSQIFKLFYSNDVLRFAKKFHRKSQFSNSKFIKNWDNFSNQQTPT